MAESMSGFEGQNGRMTDGRVRDPGVGGIRAESARRGRILSPSFGDAFKMGNPARMTRGQSSKIFLTVQMQFFSLMHRLHCMIHSDDLDFSYGFCQSTSVCQCVMYGCILRQLPLSIS